MSDCFVPVFIYWFERDTEIRAREESLRLILVSLFGGKGEGSLGKNLESVLNWIVMQYHIFDTVSCVLFCIRVLKYISKQYIQPSCSSSAEQYWKELGFQVPESEMRKICS